MEFTFAATYTVVESWQQPRVFCDACMAAEICWLVRRNATTNSWSWNRFKLDFDKVRIEVSIFLSVPSCGTRYRKKMETMIPVPTTVTPIVPADTRTSSLRGLATDACSSSLAPSCHSLHMPLVIVSDRLIRSWVYVKNDNFVLTRVYAKLVSWHAKNGYHCAIIPPGDDTAKDFSPL